MEAAAQNVIIVKEPVYVCEIRETTTKKRDDKASCRFVTIAAIR